MIKSFFKFFLYIHQQGADLALYAPPQKQTQGLI
jgi:hypothetical protein